MSVLLGMALDAPMVKAQHVADRQVGGTDTVHPLRVDDVLVNQEVRDVVISPDGNTAAVVIQRGRTTGTERYGWNYLAGYERSDVWLVERRDREPQNITRGDVDGSGFWKPVWSPDSRRLAMLSTRGGDNVRIWVFESGKKRFQPASDLGAQLEAAFGEHGPPMLWVDASKLLCALLSPGERPFRFASGGPFRRARRDALWSRTENGGTSVSVLDGGIEISEDERPQGQLTIIDLQLKRSRVLAEANVRSVALAPNGRVAAVTAEAGNIVPRADQLETWPTDMGSVLPFHVRMRRRLGVLSVRPAGKVTWVRDLINPRFSLPSASWRADATAFVVLDEPGPGTDSASRPLLVSVNGRVLGPAADTILVSRKKPAASPPAFANLQLRAHSTAAAFAVYTSEPKNSTLLWTFDRVDVHPKIRIRLNPHLASVADDVGQDTVITYEGADRRRYTAQVILPAGYKQGTRYPLIVRVYPGLVIPGTSAKRESEKPHGSQLAFLEPRLFTTRGYAFVQPSIPVSTGEPIIEMAGYVLPAIDTLVAWGIADSARVGLLGHSHGAVAVYGLLTLTGRFAAAVAINGASDILQEYAGFNASHLESDFPGEWATSAMAEFETAPHGLWLGATPWALRGRWYRNNPIYHFDRIQTPLMIVHADNDIYYMSHADVAFQSLHRLGKRVRYVRYWGEAHVIQSPGNIRDLWTRMYTWFDRHFSRADPSSARGRP